MPQINHCNRNLPTLLRNILLDLPLLLVNTTRPIPAVVGNPLELKCATLAANVVFVIVTPEDMLRFRTTVSPPSMTPLLLLSIKTL